MSPLLTLALASSILLGQLGMAIVCHDPIYIKLGARRREMLALACIAAMFVPALFLFGFALGTLLGAV